ncbi:MAG: AAA family ATPase, partial [Alphaproteobacteria bacterium]|nr:AAA family ATPase [Alphaproteobacteria bacterium]
MLVALSIRSFVLIERLDLEAESGFTALTGETGAGKSIILDALGLVLGGAANRKMVRAGDEQAMVTAEFALPEAHKVWPILAGNAIEARPSETLTLRRMVPEKGPSRAFVNGQPVNAQLLGEIGELLVEVHGQHAASGLMRPSS